MYSGGHRGLLLRLRPKRYLRTSQQQKMTDALNSCGIKKGITKFELMKAMKECIPQFFKEHK